MKEYERFLTERKKIGEGVTSEIFLWDGYAYKCYKKGFVNSQTIEYEKYIQTVVNQNYDNVVKFYDSDFDNCIKMDYINGISLADYMRKEQSLKGIELLAALFKQIHAKKGLALFSLKDSLLKDLEKVTINEKYRLKYIDIVNNKIDDKETTCHLDLHFLNVMIDNKEKPYIIDWINTKKGNEIYDFARTYVICYEFANRLAKMFYRTIVDMYQLDENLLKQAIFVMAIQRLKEFVDPCLTKLIDNMYLEVTKSN